MWNFAVKSTTTTHAKKLLRGIHRQTLCASNFFILLTVFDCLWRSVGTLLVGPYSLGRPVTIGTQMIIFAVLTVCDCLWRLVHCWYSLGRPVKIGTTMVIFAVLTVFWLFVTVSTIGSLHCCDCCTNRHKQSKTVKWHDDDDVREILFVVDKLSRHRPRHGGVQCRHRFAGCGQSIFPVEFSCRLHPYEHLAVGCAVYHLRHLLPHPLRHDDVESFLCCRTDRQQVS